jgi:oligosaccharide repeat unit polymerase
MVLALAYRTVFYTSGAAALLESKNRGLIFDTMETGKVWLLTFSFVVWLMAFIVLLINQRARRQIHVVHRVVNLAAVALFFSTYLQLGNRRELLIALLFAGMTLLLHGKYRAVALAGAIALFGGLYLGVARLFDSEARTQLDTPRLLMNMLGEAIFPNFALLSHIESGKELWLGSSYLRFPGNFLPSFGIWQKAQSLSELFAEQYGGGGMAYTHLAEGYANFGVAAVVLIPLAFALFLRLLFTWPVRRQKQQRTVIPGVVFLAMSFDVCRGEFVSNLSELLIVSFMLWLYLGIAKIEIRGKNGQ